jgi:DNA repair exonuclease SbcCD ATPase subunit
VKTKKVADLNLVLVADVHADIYPAYPEMFGNIQNALREAADIAARLPNGALVSLGDLLNPRSGKISTSVIDPMFRLFREIQEKVPVYILPGNHARGSEDRNDHAERPLGGLSDVTFFDTYTATELSAPGSDLKVLLCWVPYTDSREEFVHQVTELRSALRPGQTSVLFTHQAYTGGDVGDEEEGFAPPEKFWSLPDDLFIGFTHVFSGHFHRHQTLSAGGGKVTYVGSLIQRNFGDRGLDKGPVILSLFRDHIEFAQHPLYTAPHFHYVLLDSLEALEAAKVNPAYTNCYIRPIVTHPSITPEGIASIPSLRTISPSWNLTPNVEVRADITDESTPEEMMQAWMEYAYGGLSAEEQTALLQTGFDLYDAVADDIQFQERTAQGVIEFGDLTLTNFGAFKEAKLHLGGTGVTVIGGLNGVGKTTLGEALDFVVFDEYRGEADEVINLGETSCQVSLTFRINGEDCEIRRGRKRKGKKSEISLYFRQGAVEHTGDIQEHINKAFGVGYNVWRQVVNIRRVMPFAQSTNAERHKLLDSVLESSYWDIPLKATSKAYGDTMKQISSMEATMAEKASVYEGIDLKIADLESRDRQHALLQEERKNQKAAIIRHLESSRAETARELEKVSAPVGADIAQIEAQIEAGQTALNNLETPDLTRLEELQTLHRELEQSSTTARSAATYLTQQKEQKKRGLDSVLQNARTLIGKRCPKCLTPITEDTFAHCQEEVTAGLQRELDEMTTTIAGHQQTIVDNQTLLQELGTEIVAIKEVGNVRALTEKSITDLQLKRANAAVAQTELVEKRKTLKTKLDGIDTNLEEKRNEVIQLEASPYTELIEKEKEAKVTLGLELETFLADLEATRSKARYQGIWMEGFSRTGIRSLALDRHIPQINTLGNEGIQDTTDGRISLELGSTSSTQAGKLKEEISLTIRNSRGHSNYARNSSGQQTLVNSSLTLAVNELILAKRNHGFGLVWFDEAFDALAGPWCETLARHLKKRALRRRIILVSHNPVIAGQFEHTLEVREVGQYHSELVQL